jgi:ribokinase
MSKQPHVLVVGSLNMDLVVRAPRIPGPGETILGGGFQTIPGGKGANQAVAAARLGAKVTMVGSVGADAFGERLLDNLRQEGVDVSFIQVHPQEATGIAMIVVDDAGQNSITVASGANFTVTVEQVAAAFEKIEPADVLVMPLETPPPTIDLAARLAKAKGMLVLLNPAPARPLSAELLGSVDVLVPNEPEAAQLTSLPVDSNNQACQAARKLIDQGAGCVVITLGGRGSLVLESASPGCPAQILPPYPVQVVDTTAAGDAFMGALAVAMAEGRDLTAAAAFANAAGALTVTKPGAQPSLPLRRDVDELGAYRPG